jgi:hypothetical protein
VVEERRRRDLLPAGKFALARKSAYQSSTRFDNEACPEGTAELSSVLAVFAVEYDLLPHTSEPSITHGRPLIDYLYYEVITFTTVGYGDIIPATAHGKLLAICTALLGATHGVTFVALVLQALTQHPPAKSQE